MPARALMPADQLMKPDQIDALVEQHGVITHVIMLPTYKLRIDVHPDYDEDGALQPRRVTKAAFFEVVLRNGRDGEYKALRAAVRGPHAASAQEQLVRKLVVHPSPEVFDSIMKVWPGLAEGLGPALVNMQALSREETEKS